ncbi:hypothetical protein QDX21_03560 [Auritidibacter ignavus]|uniref:Uncharacterized protein n=1 Tax=Auritidibacter ignavus TaxID=678932 RepID=A0AAJ6AKG1_9MICC|nr:hypothetical protein [Auritidibacter ignavus]WGH93889.1 hypothetical protein QDX21_03560 [Auritidibacter ignavus]
MSPAKYKIIRIALGLAPEDVAEKFGVQVRSAKRWETVNEPPAPVVEWVTGLYERYQQVIEQTLENVDMMESEHGLTEVYELSVYESEDSLRRAMGDDMTLRMHNTLVGHIVMAFGDLDAVNVGYVPEEL